MPLHWFDVAIPFVIGMAFWFVSAKLDSTKIQNRFAIAGLIIGTAFFVIGVKRLLEYA